MMETREIEIKQETTTFEYWNNRVKSLLEAGSFLFGNRVEIYDDFLSEFDRAVASLTLAQREKMLTDLDRTDMDNVSVFKFNVAGCSLEARFRSHLACELYYKAAVALKEKEVKTNDIMHQTIGPKHIIPPSFKEKSQRKLDEIENLNHQRKNLCTLFEESLFPPDYRPDDVARLNAKCKTLINYLHAQQTPKKSTKLAIKVKLDRIEQEPKGAPLTGISTPQNVPTAASSQRQDKSKKAEQILHHKPAYVTPAVYEGEKPPKPGKGNKNKKKYEESVAQKKIMDDAVKNQPSSSLPAPQKSTAHITESLRAANATQTQALFPKDKTEDKQQPRKVMVGYVPLSLTDAIDKIRFICICAGTPAFSRRSEDEVTMIDHIDHIGDIYKIYRNTINLDGKTNIMEGSTAIFNFMAFCHQIREKIASEKLTEVTQKVAPIASDLLEAADNELMRIYFDTLDNAKKVIDNTERQVSAEIAGKAVVELSKRSSSP